MRESTSDVLGSAYHSVAKTKSESGWTFIPATLQTINISEHKGGVAIGTCDAVSDDGKKIRSLNCFAVDENKQTGELSLSANPEGASSASGTRIAMYVTRDALRFYQDGFYGKAIEQVFENPKVNCAFLFTSPTGKTREIYCDTYYRAGDIKPKITIDRRPIEGEFQELFGESAPFSPLLVDESAAEKQDVDLLKDAAKANHVNRLSTSLLDGMFRAQRGIGHELAAVAYAQACASDPDIDKDYVPSIVATYKAILTLLLYDGSAPSSLFLSSDEKLALKVVKALDHDSIAVKETLLFVDFVKKAKKSQHNIGEQTKIFDEMMQVFRDGGFSYLSTKGRLASFFRQLSDMNRAPVLLDGNSLPVGPEAEYIQERRADRKETEVFFGAPGVVFFQGGNLPELSAQFALLNEGTPFVVKMTKQQYVDAQSQRMVNVAKIAALAGSDAYYIMGTCAISKKSKTISDLGFVFDEKIERVDPAVWQNGETIDLFQEQACAPLDKSIAASINTEINRAKKLIRAASLVSEDFKKALRTFSPISNIGLTKKAFPSLSHTSPEKVGMVSVGEILADPNLINAYSLFPELMSVVADIAQRAGLSVPKPTAIVYPPSTGSAGISPALKKEHITDENLGMGKYRYTPTLDIRKEEDKRAFLSMATSTFGELEDTEELREMVSKSGYVSVLTELVGKDGFLLSLPVVCLMSETGETVGSLAVDIYQYVNMLESTKNLSYKDLIKKPVLKDVAQIEVAHSVQHFLGKMYSSVLGEDAEPLASMVFKSLKHKEPNSAEAKEMREAALYAFYSVLFKYDAFRHHAKELQEEVKNLPIPPLEKKVLGSLLSNGCFKSKIEQIDAKILQYKEINPDQHMLMQDTLGKMRKVAYGELKRAEKELRSFIYFLRLFDATKGKKELLASKDQERISLCAKKCRTLLEEWGTKAMGLHDSQVEDALNALTLVGKNKLEGINFFHSMGTGKTRLTIFYLLLEAMTFKQRKAYFAIQNKNKQDIYEQLGEMLPSLQICSNYFFNEKSTEMGEVSSLPIPLVKYAFPNFFDPTLSKIFQSNTPSSTVKDIYSDSYMRVVRNAIYWAENNPKYEDALANFSPVSKSAFYAVAEQKRVIVDEELVRLGSTFPRSAAQHYFNSAKISAFASLVFFERMKNAGAVKDGHDIERKIVDKFASFYKEYFESAVLYEKKQKDTKFSLISQSMLSYFSTPSVSVQTYQQGNSGKKTKVLIEEDVDEPSFRTSVLLSSRATPEMLYDEYIKPLLAPLLPADNSLVYLLGNFDGDTILNTFEPKIKGAIFRELYAGIDSSVMSLEQIEACEKASKMVSQKMVAAQERMIESSCLAIFNDGVPIQSLCFDAGNIALNEEELEGAPDMLLIKSEHPALYEKIVHLCTSSVALSKAINTLILGQVYAEFVAPTSFSKKIRSIPSLVGTPTEDISLNFNLVVTEPSLAIESGVLVGAINNRGKDGESATLELCFIHSAISRSMDEANPIEDNVEHAPPTTIKASISPLNVFTTTVGFKKPCALSYGLSFQCPAVYIPQEAPLQGRDKTVAIDEAHKNHQRNSKAFSAVFSGATAVSLTGTPVNGTPLSVAKRAIPKATEEEQKTFAKQIGLSAGVQKIKNSFFMAIFSYPEFKHDVLSIIRKAADACTKTMADKEERRMLHLSPLVGKLEAKYLQLIAESRDTFSDVALEAIIKACKCHTTLEKSLYRLLKIVLDEGKAPESALFLAINVSDVEFFPGFANPKAIAHYIEQENAETSIKEGENRKYVFGNDAQNLVDGTIAPLDSFSFNEKARKHKFHLLSYAMLFISKANKAATSAFIKIAIEKIANATLYSPIKTDREKSCGTVIDILDALEPGHGIRTSRELLAQLSASNVSGNDNIVQIIKEKIGAYSTREWGEISSVKKAAIFFLTQMYNELVPVQTIHASTSSYFSDPRTAMDVRIEIADANESSAYFQYFYHGHKDVLPPSIDSSEMRAYVDGVPFTEELIVDMRVYFPEILKETASEVPLRIKVLNSRDDEISAELFTDASERVAEHVSRGDSCLLLTARKVTLSMKIAETLTEVLCRRTRGDDPASVPFYLLANVGVDESAMEMLRNIDQSKLAAHRIYVIPTSSADLYDAYNYKLPEKCAYAIFSNYETIAEGFRFKDAKETIYAGKPGKADTFMQSASRVFFPGERFDSPITLCGNKSVPCLNKGEKLNLDSGALFEPQDAAGHKKFLEKLFSHYGELDAVPCVNGSVPQNVVTSYQRLMSSIIAMMKFMGTDFGGIKDVPPVRFIKKEDFGGYGAKEGLDAELVMPKKRKMK